MDPVLTVISAIGVSVGMWTSWTVGWHLEDWLKALFSYRVRDRGEYLEVYRQEPPVYREPRPHESIVDEFNLTMQLALSTPNEIRQTLATLDLQKAHHKRKTELELKIMDEKINQATLINNIEKSWQNYNNVDI